MNYNLVLNGTKEFYPGLNNKKYNILLCDSIIKINFMISFFESFISNQMKNPKNKHFIGCDFEFNRVQKTNKDIALFQINLENDESTGTIFIFYPPELNKEQEKILIDLLTNKYIIKILHGGESLDIPYLFDQVLKTTKNIYNFCENLYDTKYLCEYAHIEQNIEKRCSIYFLLEEYKIITNKKINDLEAIEKKMGPIYLIHIDIHKISFDVFRYSLYDVLFLPELIKKFLIKNSVYTNLLPEISRLVFQYKRLPSHSINSMKNIVTKFNIHFIKIIINSEEHIFLLNDVYQYYLLTLVDPNKVFNNLYKITYFKDFLDNLLRYIVYIQIQNNQQIYESKNVLAAKIPIYKFQNHIYVSKLIERLSQVIKKN